MDRIKVLSMQVLNKHKDEFTTDFSENKKILDKIAIIRSKGLKNEMAGYITKYLKREIDSKAQKMQKEAQNEAEETEESVEAPLEEQIDAGETEETAEETVEDTAEAQTTEDDSESQEIVMETKTQESN